MNLINNNIFKIVIRANETGKRESFREIAVDITKWKEKIDESAKELAKANEWIEKNAPYVYENESNKRIDRKNSSAMPNHQRLNNT